VGATGRAADGALHTRAGRRAAAVVTVLAEAVEAPGQVGFAVVRAVEAGGGPPVLAGSLVQDAIHRLVEGESSHAVVAITELGDLGVVVHHVQRLVGGGRHGAAVQVQEATVEGRADGAGDGVGEVIGVLAGHCDSPGLGCVAAHYFHSCNGGAGRVVHHQPSAINAIGQRLHVGLVVAGLGGSERYRGKPQVDDANFVGNRNRRRSRVLGGRVEAGIGLGRIFPVIVQDQLRLGEGGRRNFQHSLGETESHGAAGAGVLANLDA